MLLLEMTIQHMAVERNDRTQNASPDCLTLLLIQSLVQLSTREDNSLKRSSWVVRMVCIREHGMELISPSEYQIALAIVFCFLFTIFRC